MFLLKWGFGAEDEINMSPGHLSILILYLSSSGARKV